MPDLMKQAILLVDDDVSVTASLALLLKQAGYFSECAANPQEALALLGRGEFSLVIQDMNFSRQTSGEEGLALLAEVKRLKPGMPVILITAWGSISLAVQGLRSRAGSALARNG